jgi:hypothetical protein
VDASTENACINGKVMPYQSCDMAGGIDAIDTLIFQYLTF